MSTARILSLKTIPEPINASRFGSIKKMSKLTLEDVRINIYSESDYQKVKDLSLAKYFLHLDEEMFRTKGINLWLISELKLNEVKSVLLVTDEETFELNNTISSILRGLQHNHSKAEIDKFIIKAVKTINLSSTDRFDKLVF